MISPSPLINRPNKESAPWLPRVSQSVSAGRKEGARKRLLILSSRLPFGARSGDSVRLMHIARALSRDYELTLLSLSERAPDPSIATLDRAPFSAVHVVRLPRWHSYLQTLLAVPTRTPLQLAYYRSKTFRQTLSQLLPDHDGVVAHLQRTGQYVDHLAGSKPVILDMTDAISLTYRRARRLRKKREYLDLVYALEQKRLAKFERSAPARFSESWLVSPVDIEYLFGNATPASVDCVPVPVDLADFPFRPHVSGETILFIGNLRSVPNRDACFWFCSEVFSALRERRPTLRFRIIGAADAATKAQLEALPGVEVLGEVEHIRDHLHDVFCGVCPVRAGAGIQNKVLNYLALGLPCVTSDIGLEGIRAAHGSDLLCFSTAAEAIEQISMLADTPALRDRLRAQGLFVAKTYSTDQVYPYMQARAQAIFGQPEYASSRVPLELLAQPERHTNIGAGVLSGPSRSAVAQSLAP